MGSYTFISKSNLIKNLQSRIESINILLSALVVYKLRLRKYEGRQYNKGIDNNISIDGVDIYRREEEWGKGSEKRIYITFYAKGKDNNFNSCCIYLPRYNEKEENFRKIDCEYIFKEVDKCIRYLTDELADKKEGLSQIDNFVEQSYKLKQLLETWQESIPHCLQSWNELGRPSIQVHID